jgi:hypothetical protein
MAALATAARPLPFFRHGYIPEMECPSSNKTKKREKHVRPECEAVPDKIFIFNSLVPLPLWFHTSLVMAAPPFGPCSALLWPQNRQLDE